MLTTLHHFSTRYTGYLQNWCVMLEKKQDGPLVLCRPPSTWNTIKIDSSVTAVTNVHSRKFYKMLESLELNSFQVTASAWLRSRSIEPCHYVTRSNKTFYEIKKKLCYAHHEINLDLPKSSNFICNCSDASNINITYYIQLVSCRRSWFASLVALQSLVPMTQIFQDFWAVSFSFKLFLDLPVNSQVNVAFASNLTGLDPVSQCASVACKWRQFRRHLRSLSVCSAAPKQVSNNYLLASFLKHLMKKYWYSTRYFSRPKNHSALLHLQQC